MKFFFKQSCLHLKAVKLTSFLAKYEVKILKQRDVQFQNLLSVSLLGKIKLR